MTFAERRRLFLFLLGAPAVAYVLAVAVWPLSQGIYFSFFDYSLLRPAQRTFVGLGNYRELLTDPAARGSILTTVQFTIAAVGLQFVLGLGLALLLWRDSLFHRICLALLLIPVAMTPLVVGLVFRALLGPDFGMIGFFAAEWGLSGPRGFLGDPATALGALVAIDTWQWTPLMALILLAGLKSLPTDILEAARADGATALQRLRLVILPMLLPSIFLALVLRTMDAFRVFDIVFATTNGGPGDATNVLMVLRGEARAAVLQRRLRLGDRQHRDPVHRGVLRRLHRPRAARRGEGARAMTAPRQAVLERALLAAIVALFLLPVAWLVTTAYKPARAIFSIPPTLWFTPTLDNFRGAMRYFDLPHLVESSLVIACGSAALSLLIGVPAGYALARARTRLAPAVAWFFLAVRTVPPVATLIPFYLMMRDLGLLGTWWAVILLNTTLNSAFVVWMMFASFRSLPREMEEAALCDGCTLFGSFWRVALPLGEAGHHRQRAPVHHVQLERFPVRRLPHPRRDQDARGGAADRLRHHRHQLGNAGRAGPLLDPPDRDPGARPQPLFRPGADHGSQIGPVHRSIARAFAKKSGPPKLPDLSARARRGVP